MSGDRRLHPSYVLYRAGRAVATAVPERLLFPGAEAVGRIVARVNGRRRDVVARNLQRVVGHAELDRRVDEAFASYARYWVETLRIPAPGADEIRRRTTADGLDAVRDRIEAGEGIVFCTPHLGSWDVAGAWLAAQGWRVVAIAERLEPPELFELFTDLRRSVGIEVYPLGKASSAAKLLASLRRGAVVGLVADRDISRSGVEVEFFGEPTMLPTGPAVLAMRTGAALVAGALYQRPGGRYHAVLLDPIPVEGRSKDAGAVRDVTQRMAHALEELIRRDPGQWHLFQPNWPTDPGYHREA